jgi:hypothetical protein
MLSTRQFAGLASQVNDPNIGGFTAITKGPHAGKSPASKYLVGTGTEETVNSALNAGHIKDYAGRHQASLATSDKYLGGWSNDGKAYLDTPKGFDTTPQGHSAARKATLATNEQAYGETNADREYVKDHNNPYHPENKKGDIVASDDPGQRKIWSEMPLSAPQSPSGKKIPERDNHSFT